MREELDYVREARHVALYRAMLADVDIVRVPRARPELSTGRLLTLDWLDGSKLLPTGTIRSTSATDCHRHVPRVVVSFSRFGVIHGDPHLGNYTVFARDGAPAGINLLDFGCIRIFPPDFVRGVVDLYDGFAGRRRPDRARLRDLGLSRLSRDIIDTLNIWARFIYAPLLDDRVRTSPTASRRRHTAGARRSACTRRSSRKAR